MYCEMIMKKSFVSVRPDQTAQEAAHLMLEGNFGFLPVCDPSGHVLGTLTDRDLAIRLVAHDLPAATTPVSALMTHEVISCLPTDDLARAEELMGLHHKSRILCTDESDMLLGVISLSDIAHVDDSDHTARTIREITAREAEFH